MHGHLIETFIYPRISQADYSYKQARINIGSLYSRREGTKFPAGPYSNTYEAYHTYPRGNCVAPLLGIYEFRKYKIDSRVPSKFR